MTHLIRARPPQGQPQVVVARASAAAIDAHAHSDRASRTAGSNWGLRCSARGRGIPGAPDARTTGPAAAQTSSSCDDEAAVIAHADADTTADQGPTVIDTVAGRPRRPGPDPTVMHAEGLHNSTSSRNPVTISASRTDRSAPDPFPSSPTQARHAYRSEESRRPAPASATAGSEHSVSEQPPASDRQRATGPSGA